MPHSRDVPDNLVVAIATTDDWFQAGTAADIIAHGHSHVERDPHGDADQREGAARHLGGAPHPDDHSHEDDDGGHSGGGRRLAFDFFDTTGRPLRPLLGIDLGVIRFAPFGEAAPDTVEARLRRAIGVGLAYLAEHPDQFPSRSLPALPEAGDLPALAHWARDAMSQDDRGHMGGWFHNVMHALLG